MAFSIRVNDEVISEEAILEEMQYHPSAELPRKQAADALVIRSLLLQEARRLKIEATPMQFGKGRKEVPDEALVRTLLESRVSVEPPGEETCRGYYETHRDRFFSPVLYEPRHILYAANTENTDEIQSATRRAISAIEILSRDPGKFDEIARTESDCTSRENNGFLGQLGPGDTVPEFEFALTNLEEGQVYNEPVFTRYGVHVIRLDHRIDGKQLPFHSVHQRIADYLSEKEWRHKFQIYLRALIDKAEIDGWEPDEN